MCWFLLYMCKKKQLAGEQCKVICSAWVYKHTLICMNYLKLLNWFVWINIIICIQNICLIYKFFIFKWEKSGLNEWFNDSLIAVWISDFEQISWMIQWKIFFNSDSSLPSGQTIQSTQTLFDVKKKKKRIKKNQNKKQNNKNDKNKLKTLKTITRNFYWQKQQTEKTTK